MLTRLKSRLRTSEGPLSPSSAADASPRAASAHSVSERDTAYLASCQRVSARIQRKNLRVGPDAPKTNDFGIFDTVAPADRDEVLRHAQKDRGAKRAMGAMVGMAVADSVGHEFEFIPVGEKGCHFDKRTLKITGAHNRFKLKPGQWTDDTAMGLCMADSLLVRSRYDGSDIRVRFWNWWYKGYNNAFRRESGRTQSVGLGGNISMSLKDITDDSPTPRFESVGEDAGNGSLMRLAPLPIYFHSDIKLAMRLSAESSYTTHPGPIAADGCAFQAYVIIRAIYREPSRASAAHFLDECVKGFTSTYEDGVSPTLAKLFAAKEPPESTERCWNWRESRGPYLLETIKNRGMSYNGYPVSPGYFGSYSMDGLAIALHCMYHTSSFMEAIAKCINFLGDADSTGSICGQMAGAFYGVDAIDQRLVKRLEQWDGKEIALRGALLYGLGTNLGAQEQEEAQAPKVDQPYATTLSAAEPPKLAPAHVPIVAVAVDEAPGSVSGDEAPGSVSELTPMLPTVAVDEGLGSVSEMAASMVSSLVRLVSGDVPAHEKEFEKATTKVGTETGMKTSAAEPEEAAKTSADVSADASAEVSGDNLLSSERSLSGAPCLAPTMSELKIEEDARLLKKEQTWAELTSSERVTALAPRDYSCEEPRDFSCEEPPLRGADLKISCEEPPLIDSEVCGGANLSTSPPASSKVAGGTDLSSKVAPTSRYWQEATPPPTPANAKLQEDQDDGVRSEGAGSEGSDYSRSVPTSPAAPRAFSLQCCGTARPPTEGSVSPGRRIRPVTLETPARSSKEPYVFPDGVHSL